MRGLGFAFAPGLSTAAKALRILIAVVIVAGLLALAYCQGRGDGRAHERAKNAEAVAKMQEKAIQNGDKADAERIADTATAIEVEKRYAEAIDNAPGGQNSPAAVARACQQLREAGYAIADLPAECRR